MYNKSNQLNSIQLLRAIAALGVVYTHCASEGGFNIKNTGAWGVDIFFIISGFIMAYIVLRNTDHFFVKRLFRIVPLFHSNVFSNICRYNSPSISTWYCVNISKSNKIIVFYSV